MTPAQSVETLLREALVAARKELFLKGQHYTGFYGGHEDCTVCATLKTIDAALQSIPEPLLDEGLVRRVALKLAEAHDAIQNPRKNYAVNSYRAGASVDYWNGQARAALSIPRLEAGRVTELHAAIAHGDADHREWLKEAIEAFFAGKPIPPLRGLGTKEARIAMLEAQVAKLSSASAPDGEDR